jgi:hypothetical protein
MIETFQQYLKSLVNDRLELIRNDKSNIVSLYYKATESEKAEIINKEGLLHRKEGISMVESSPNRVMFINGFVSFADFREKQECEIIFNSKFLNFEYLSDNLKTAREDIKKVEDSRKCREYSYYLEAKISLLSYLSNKKRNIGIVHYPYRKFSYIFKDMNIPFMK